MTNQLRTTLTAAIGTTLEWAEYIFYGYMASQISPLFFPNMDKRTALLAAFAVFAIGFLARPIGGIIFGHIGDRIGRRKALTLAMLTMGIATFLIGSLPTYHSIGIMAPVLLIICRLLQGLAVSGEYNGSAIFVIEHYKGKNPYLAGSWTGMAAASGMLLGSLVVTLVTLPGMPSWSWRMAFWLGSLSCFVSYYLRTKVSESPAFLAFQQQQKLVSLPIVTVIKEQKKALFITAAIAAFVGINVYICNLYYVSFLINHSNFSTHNASLVAVFSNIAALTLLPIVGSFTNSNNAKSLMFSGLFLAAISAPIIFHLGVNATMGQALFAQLLYAISDAMVCAPMYKFLFDLFPTSTRYTGTTFAWSVSVALFCGPAPMIAEYLVGQKHLIEGPAILVCLSALVAFFAIMRTQEEPVAESA